MRELEGYPYTNGRIHAATSEADENRLSMLRLAESQLASVRRARGRLVWNAVLLAATSLACAVFVVLGPIWPLGPAIFSAYYLGKLWRIREEMAATERDLAGLAAGLRRGCAP